MKINREQILPTILMIIDVFAAIGYLPTGNWRKILYWLFAAGLTFVVTY